MVATLPGLVERHDELAVVRDALHDDGGRVLLVEGGAGSGKSELLRAAVAGAPTDMAVLAGACEPLEIPAAFAPLFEVLRSLPDPLAEQIRTGSEGLAVYAAFLELLRSRRTLLAIDDVQWADPSSVGLLRYLGRRIADTPSVLVVACRSEARRGDVRRDVRERGLDARPASERVHPSGLTPRQLDVLCLLADGLSNAAIAERLFISPKTAGHHVSAILTRTGTRSRGEAVAVARSNAWL